MGQKVNPHGLRVGVIKDWDSKWYAEADFADNLIEDHEIRKFLKKKNGITLIALVVTTIFSYDEFIKSSNNKGFFLQSI